MLPEEYDRKNDIRDGVSRPLPETTRERIGDLIVAAAEAADAGQSEWADYWMHRAERAAARNGNLSLLWLVWRHDIGAVLPG